jgi:hypothetical protein
MAGRQKSSGSAAIRECAPAIDPEDREKQLISMAVSITEQKMRDGTAPTALIMHYLKIATTREQLEKKKLEKEISLLESKKAAADSAIRIEELYADAIEAMTTYGSSINREDEVDWDE